MSIELDERLRRLGEFAISEPRPVQRIAARGQQIRRRRRVLTAALLLVLLVGTVAGVTTVLGGGDDRVHVASSHKEVGRELRYLSGYVVPNDASAGTLARAQQALERSAVVEQYVTMPPGWASVRLATDLCRQSPCVPATADRLRLACAALGTGSFAVQVARVPDAATRLRDGLGGDAKLYTIDGLGDVELFMNLAADSAQTTRLRTAIAADHDVASYRFLDHQAQYREFENLERDQPAVRGVLPRDLPESFRLYLRADASPATVRHRYQTFPGVHDAVLTGQPLNGLFDYDYLRWLRGPQSPAPRHQPPFCRPRTPPSTRAARRGELQSARYFQGGLMPRNLKATAFAMLVSVATGIVLAAPAALAGPSRIGKITLKEARLDWGTSAVAALRAQPSSAATIPTFTASVHDGASTFSYTMVGKNPFVPQTEPSTTVKTLLIPVVITFSNGDSWDPRAIGSVRLRRAAARTKNSRSSCPNPGSSALHRVGRGQYVWRVPTGEFLQPDQSDGPQPRLPREAGAQIPRRSYSTFPTPARPEARTKWPNGKLGGGISCATPSSQGYITSTLGPAATRTFPLFLLGNVVAYSTSAPQCCVLGYLTR